MVFGIGDSLSVRVSAQTQDFERGMASASNSLEELRTDAVETTAGLQVLQNRANEAEDDVSKLGRSARTTAGSLTALTGASFGAATGTRALAGATVTSLIPALVTLTAVATPIVATLGGLAAAAVSLAGAFGAVIGTGILAFGKEQGAQNRERLRELRDRIQANKTRRDQIEAQIDQLEELRREQDGLTAAQQEQLQSLIAQRNELERTIDKQEETADKVEETTGIMGGLKDAMADLREEIAPILVAFGQQFIPVIEAAIEALPGFVQSVLDAIGPLDDFVDALFTLGSLAQKEIPDLVARLADLARNALPGFIDAVQSVANNAGPAFNTIIDTTRDVLPVLNDLGESLGDLIVQLNDFGRTLAGPVVGGVADLVDGLTRLLDRINDLNERTQTLIGVGSLLAPIFGALATLISVLGGPLTVLIGLVGGLASAWISNFRNIRGQTEQVIGRVRPLLMGLWENTIQPLIQGLSNISLDFSAGGLEDAPASIQNLANSLGGLGDELLTTGETLFNFFSRVGTVVMTTLRENRPTIRRFANAVVNALAGVIDVLAGLVRSWRFIFTTVIAPITMRLVRLWGNRFGPVVGELAQTLNHLSRVLRDVGTVLGRFWSAHGDEITTGLRFFADIVGTVLVSALDGLFTALSVVLNILQGDFRAAWNDLGGVVSRAGERMVAFAQRWEIGSVIAGQANNIVDTFASAFTQTLPALLISAAGQIIGIAEFVATQMVNSILAQLQVLAAEVDRIFVMVGNSIINALNTVISRMQTLIAQLPSDEVPSELRNITQLERLESGGNLPVVNTLTTDARQAQQQAVEELAVELGINIEGDSQLAQIIRENANIVIEERERRVNRETGRGGSIQ